MTEYIYESPDKGKTVYRRKFGDYHNREKIAKIYMKENGKMVRCPLCNSTEIKAVRGFDYVKMCMNNDCVYGPHQDNPTRWRYQFSTGVHN